MQLVDRQRLLRDLSGEPIGLIEAGSGSGKSVLASQYAQSLGIAVARVTLDRSDSEEAALAASLRRALRHANLSDLAAASYTAEPPSWLDRLLDALAANEEGLLLVIDDAHHLGTGPGAGLLLRLARGLPPHHRLLIAARSFVGPLEPLWELEHAALVDGRSLAFTLEEAAALVRATTGRAAREHDVRMLVEATNGWATALILAVTEWQRNSGQPSWLARDPVAAALRTILAGMAPEDRAAAAALAHLPYLSPEVTEATGRPGLFERMATAGVPLVRTELEWWEMPGPVAAGLAAQAPIDAQVVSAAADIYARHGDTLTAIRVLISSGAAAAAAQRLAAMAPHAVEQLGLGAVRAIVDSLPEAVVGAHPRVLLHLARMAETAHLGELRETALARARRHAAAAEDAALALELEAELARDLMWDERTRPRSRSVAEAVLDAAGSGDTIARARALDVLGRLGGWFSLDGPQPKAEALLQESAHLARSIGERTWAAQALVALGGGFYFALCRFEQSLAVLDEALGDLPARNRYRAMVQSFRADALNELGRFAEAEAAVADMRQTARAFGDDWIVAYTAWNEALLASYQGDAARTVRAVAEALQHPHGWFDQPSGVEFLAQASDYLDRVGESDRARRHLQQARERMQGSEHLVHVHGAAIEARSGDPQAAAGAIDAALASWAIEPQERWPLLLLRAHAALRRGDPEAGALAAEAFDTCLELGHPRGPLIREPAVARALLPLAREAGSLAAAALDDYDAAPAWTIQLLGGFAVRRGGRELVLPPGRPVRAVQALAGAGGRMHGEELIELLWPGVAIDVGRRRLRNLLSRIRAAAGELVVRDGEIVCLAPRCEVDADRFAAQAQAALVARAPDARQLSTGLARSALDLYHGQLLPDASYEDWVIDARQRLAATELALLDVLTKTAEDEDEIDEAVRLVRRAIAADPHDESRHLALARLLSRQGRSGAAAAALQRALADDGWPAAARRRLGLALAELTGG